MTVAMILYSIPILFLFPLLSQSANFLVYCPLFAHSHHKFLANLAESLTVSGHNVTFLAPIIARKYENVKYLKHTKDLIYIQPDEELEKLGDLMDSTDFSQFWTAEIGVTSMIPTLRLFFKMFAKVHENLKKDLTVLDGLRNRNFDALIYEVPAFNAIAIQQYLGIRTLLPTFSVTHHMTLSKTIGEPALPSTLSSPLSPFGDRMTFEERLINTVTDSAMRLLVQRPEITSFKYPNNVINLEEAESRSSFVFLNSNPFLDFPRPTLPKTVQIGGISVNVTEMRMEKLSKEFDEILNLRNKSILISFGSVMFSKDMPEQYKLNIVRVIESFPDVTFIWKYETDDVAFAGNIENLHFSKWVPQTALLADPRLSVFITHAGLGSVHELSYMGKPAILIPIFADQMRNAKMLARHNGSIELNKRELANYGKLRNTIKTILQDPSYRKNAEILGRQLSRQPVSPQDLFVKHAVFASEFGELPSLDPSSRHMSFFTFYMIDIFLFFLSIFLLALGFVFYTTRTVLVRITKKKRE